jgi:hypothetical protein
MSDPTARTKCQASGRSRRREGRERGGAGGLTSNPGNCSVRRDPLRLGAEGSRRETRAGENCED